MCVIDASRKFTRAPAKLEDVTGSTEKKSNRRPHSRDECNEQFNLVESVAEKLTTFLLYIGGVDPEKCPVSLAIYGPILTASITPNSSDIFVEIHSYIRRD